MTIGINRKLDNYLVLGIVPPGSTHQRVGPRAVPHCWSCCFGHQQCRPSSSCHHPPRTASAPAYCTRGSPCGTSHLAAACGAFHLVAGWAPASWTRVADAACSPGWEPSHRPLLLGHIPALKGKGQLKNFSLTSTS